MSEEVCAGKSHALFLVLALAKVWVMFLGNNWRGVDLPFALFVGQTNCECLPKPIR